MSATFPNNPEFRKLLNQDEHGVDLIGLLLEFAADAYPALDPAPTVAEIDRLGLLAREAVAGVEGIAARLTRVSELLYEREGFRGDQESYYDPRNSYLNDVVARRMGIPISLAMVYTAVGRRAGVEVYGVGTPGHFVVGCQEGGATWYLDPFTDGAVFDEFVCRERIHRVIGASDALTSAHFRPATPTEIAARVLRNLKAAHAMRDDWPAALPVQTRLTALLPDVLDERRDLGLIYLRNGDPFPAVPLLESYADAASEEAAAAVRPYLKTARRLAAERN